MTAEARVHVGAIGLVIRLTIVDQDGSALNVSTSTEKEILLQGPEDTAATAKTAVFYTDGSDGIIQYTTTSADDLDHEGQWQAQAYCLLSGGSVWRSSIYKFPVEANLEEAS